MKEGVRYESVSMDVRTCVWIKYTISHSMHTRCFRASCWLVALWVRSDFRWKHALKIEAIRHFPFLILSQWIVNRLLFLKDQNINSQELRFFWQNLYCDKFPFLRFFRFINISFRLLLTWASFRENAFSIISEHHACIFVCENLGGGETELDTLVVLYICEVFCKWIIIPV